MKIFSLLILLLTTNLTYGALTPEEQAFVDIVQPFIDEIDEDLHWCKQEIEDAASWMEYIITTEQFDKKNQALDRVSAAQTDYHAKMTAKRALINGANNQSLSKFNKKLFKLIPVITYVSVAVTFSGQVGDVYAGDATPVEALRNITISELPYEIQIGVKYVQGGDAAIHEIIKEWSVLLVEVTDLENRINEMKNLVDYEEKIVRDAIKPEAMNLVADAQVLLNFLNGSYIPGQTEYNDSAALKAAKIQALDFQVQEMLQSFDWYKSGDTDGDGDVDFLDFLKMSSNMDTPSGMNWADGDFNNDGAVDFADFLLLSANYQ